VSAEAQPNTSPQPDTSPPPSAPAGGIADYFKFAERGTDIATEARAGVTTFMVMAYIIFLNGNIIAKPLGLDPIAVSAGTALIAGIMTIAMGLVGNYPFALAAGLGINAIVAFTLTAKGLDAKGAMGVIVLEGVAITVLVAIGLREAIMNAVPIALKRAIGVGIGLFILFIGFANGGMVVSNCAPDSADLGFCDGTLVTLSFPTSPGQFVFLLGLAITIILYARKVRAALIISILVTTVHRDPRRRPESRHQPRHDAELRDDRPRPSGSVPGVHQAWRPHRRPDDLRHHAQRLLRHDGHGDRHRRRGGSRPRGWLGPGCRARPVRRQRRRDRRRRAAASRRTRPTSRAPRALPRAVAPASHRSSPGSSSCWRSSCHRSPGSSRPRRRRRPWSWWAT